MKISDLACTCLGVCRHIAIKVLSFKVALFKFSFTASVILPGENTDVIKGTTVSINAVLKVNVDNLRLTRYLHLNAERNHTL